MVELHKHDKSEGGTASAGELADRVAARMADDIGVFEVRADNYVSWRALSSGSLPSAATLLTGLKVASSGRRQATANDPQLTVSLV